MFSEVLLGNALRVLTPTAAYRLLSLIMDPVKDLNETKLLNKMFVEPTPHGTWAHEADMTLEVFHHCIAKEILMPLLSVCRRQLQERKGTPLLAAEVYSKIPGSATLHLGRCL